jgi:hypothetical protein
MDEMDPEGEALHLVRSVSSSPFSSLLSRFGRSPRRLMDPEGEVPHLRPSRS